MRETEINDAIDRMSNTELLELKDALDKYKFLPDNQAQADAYNTKADIVFYGGSAGTGKSYLILMLAIHKHTDSIIFRKHFNEHKGPNGFISKSIEVIGDDGTFNISDGIWKGVNGNRTIQLTGLDSDAAVNKAKGKASDLKAFDEITEFTQEQFQLIQAWSRSAVVGQKCQIFCTGNPPTTPEGTWVIEYWAPWLDPAHPFPAESCELRWYATIGDKETGQHPVTKKLLTERSFMYRDELVEPMSRTFIRGEMVSHLKKTGYEKRLKNLAPGLREKLYEGIFVSKMSDDPWQVISSEHVQMAMDRWKATEEPSIPVDRIGVDVARSGPDQTVLAQVKNNYYLDLIRLSKKVTADGHSLAEEIVKRMGGNEQINIDILNVGCSPYDFLKRHPTNPNVQGVNVSKRADKHATDRTKTFHFKNLRAQLIWKFAESLDPVHGDDICLPPDRKLKMQLCTFRYKINGDKIQIESKDDIKKRLKRSPDDAEAVIYASYKYKPNQISANVPLRGNILSKRRSIFNGYS